MIFEKFYAPARATGCLAGTGLGLASQEASSNRWGNNLGRQPERPVRRGLHAAAARAAE